MKNITEFYPNKQGRPKQLGEEEDLETGKTVQQVIVDLTSAYLASLIADLDLLLHTHAFRHENGGEDEIDVTGLSGVLADPQTPILHAETHESGGTDEIDVTDLIGVLANPQHPIVSEVKPAFGYIVCHNDEVVCYNNSVVYI